MNNSSPSSSLDAQVAAATKKTALSKAMLTELTSGMSITRHGQQGDDDEPAPRREVYEQMSSGAVFFMKDRLSMIQKVQQTKQER